VQDPFADKSNKNYQREIQMWMTVLMCLVVAFLYLAIKRMNGPESEIPDYVLQSSVTHVSPIELDRAETMPAKSSYLSSVPPIRSGSFPTKVIHKPKQIVKLDPNTKPDFGFANPPSTSNRLPKVAPELTAAGRLNNASLPFPKPTFVKPEKVPSVDTAVDAVGRERAKQLAALTSGLPERLNQIHSSVKRATAELPADAVAADDNPPEVDNGFVPTSPFKATIRSPLKPIVEPPKKFVNTEPIEAVKPILVQSVAKNSLASEPLVDSPALAPIPSPTVARVPRPSVKKGPDSNSFVPLPSLRPNVILEDPNATVEAPKSPLPVEPVRKSSEIVKSVEAVSHSSSGQKQHVVQAGESFFTIAQQHYGDAQWFRALRLANQSVASGGELPVGVSLIIPTTAELTSQFPEYALRTAAEQPSGAEQRIYMTQAGDTLFDIARRKTGQGSRFSEIIDSNELRLPAQIRASDQLPEGLRLVLPESSLE